MNIEELHSTHFLTGNGFEGEIIRNALADVDSAAFTGVGEGQRFIIKRPGCYGRIVVLR